MNQKSVLRVVKEEKFSQGKVALMPFFSSVFLEDLSQENVNDSSGSDHRSVDDHSSSIAPRYGSRQNLDSLAQPNRLRSLGTDPEVRL